MKNPARTLLLMCIMLSSILCRAQPDPFDDFGGDAEVPLDGGVIFLIMATLGYTAKKLYEERKRRQEVK